MWAPKTEGRANHHFDVLVVREDVALRGRARGDVAGLVADGARAWQADHEAQLLDEPVRLEVVRSIFQQALDALDGLRAEIEDLVFADSIDHLRPTASEIGKAYGGQPRALPSFRAVPPGTPGAVSIVGTLSGVGAAALIAWPPL